MSQEVQVCGKGLGINTKYKMLTDNTIVQEIFFS